MEVDEEDGHEDACSHKSPQLKEECIYEILTRVSISAQHSCLRVCRSWRRLAFGRSFDEVNSIRTKMVAGFILEYFNHEKRDYKFLSMYGCESLGPYPVPISSLLLCKPQLIRIVATAPTHSILLLNINHSFNGISNYCITRLGTFYQRDIPNPGTPLVAYFSSVVYGVNDTFDEFKIVQIYEPRYSHRYQKNTCMCNIFDSITSTWKPSNEVPCSLLECLHTPHNLLEGIQTVVMKQTSYWMIRQCFPEKSAVNYYPCIIVSFDVEMERGKEIQGPMIMHDGSENSSKWKMVAYGDNLLIVQMLSGEVRVWMMVEADGEFQNWKRIGLVSMQRLKDHNFTFEGSISDHQLMLLETLYRELWYEIKGSELVCNMEYHNFTSAMRMYLDVSNL